MKGRGIILTALLILLTSCGPKIVIHAWPSSSVDFSSEIHRISSSWVMCDGVPAHPAPNTVTGRQQCDTGDSQLWGGLLSTVQPSNALCDGLAAAYGENGRPWRSEEHRRGYEEGLPRNNSFSMDHYLGLAFHSLSCSNRVELLQRVHDYAVMTNWWLCDDDDDARCMVRPTSRLGIGWVWEDISPETKPEEYNTELPLEYIDAIAILKTVNDGKPGDSALHLATVKVYLALLTDNINDIHALAIENAYKKDPQNLWFSYLHYRLNGPKTDINTQEVEHKLLELLQNWERPTGDSWWFWKDSPNQRQNRAAMGHELVLLALLMSESTD